ncbi:MAG: hypothetical protein HY549_10765 [Elusimicrobia bacterium]|nr:hypothetical protein [Elusimicrobiota bacterium]
MNAIIALAFLLSPQAPAGMPAVSFDQGIDVRAVMQDIKAASPIGISGTRRRTGWMPGVKDIEMPPFVLLSPVFELASTELLEECTPPGPRDPGRCIPTTGRTLRWKFQLRFWDAAARAGREVFRVVMTGDDVSVVVLDSTHKYSWELRRGDISEIVFTSRPPQAP